MDPECLGYTTMVVSFTGANTFPAPRPAIAERANCELQGSPAAPFRQGWLATWPNSPKSEIAGKTEGSGDQGRRPGTQVKATWPRKCERTPPGGTSFAEAWMRTGGLGGPLERSSDESPFLNPLPLSLKPATLCAASWELPNCWELCSTGLPKVVHLRENLCRNAVNRPQTHA